MIGGGEIWVIIDKILYVEEGGTCLGAMRHRVENPPKCAWPARSRRAGQGSLVPLTLRKRTGLPRTAAGTEAGGVRIGRVTGAVRGLLTVLSGIPADHLFSEAFVLEMPQSLAVQAQPLYTFFHTPLLVSFPEGSVHNSGCARGGIRVPTDREHPWTGNSPNRRPS